MSHHGKGIDQRPRCGPGLAQAQGENSYAPPPHELPEVIGVAGQAPEARAVDRDGRKARRSPDFILDFERLELGIGEICNDNPCMLE